MPDEAACLAEADVVLKVQRPLTAAEGGPDELALMKPGAVLIGILAPYAARDQLQSYAGRNIAAFALEFTPRITRAQAMDVLSSQSRSEEHTSELQSLMRISYAVFCLTKKNTMLYIYRT